MHICMYVYVHVHICICMYVYVSNFPVLPILEFKPITPEIEVYINVYMYSHNRHAYL
jgi:hypothetical protein